MNEELIQEIVNNYNNILADIEKQNIEAMDFGFINDTCASALLSILIHCVENIEIFNSNQLNNIFNFINKLSYG